MTVKELERLSSWLRCYPVIGREDERKALTHLVERELRAAWIREGLEGEIPEQGRPDAPLGYDHECPRCHSLFNQHRQGCIRREAPPL